MRCIVHLVLLCLSSSIHVFAQIAHGPLSDADPHFPNMGWVTDHAKTVSPSVVAGVLSVQGDSRVYLVQDYMKRAWDQPQYMRIDLHQILFLLKKL